MAKVVQVTFRAVRLGCAHEEHDMKLLRLAALVVASAAAASATIVGKQESLAGAWTLSVERLGLKLMLEQKKSGITGTLDWPHGDPVKLTGMFADGTLVLSGNSAGENFDIHVDATATRKADGSLAGTLNAHFDEFDNAHKIVRTRNQSIPWTAVRGLHNIVHFSR
jgi:hypothetical protein